VTSDTPCLSFVSVYRTVRSAVFCFIVLGASLLFNAGKSSLFCPCLLCFSIQEFSLCCLLFQYTEIFVLLSFVSVYRNFCSAVFCLSIQKFSLCCPLFHYTEILTLLSLVSLYRHFRSAVPCFSKQTFSLCTPLSTKVGTKFRRQVAVSQPV
jgi:hypothetical protein